MTILRPHIEQFDAAQRKLSIRWQATRAAWDDPVSHDFEKKVILPLDQQLQRTRRELERLFQVVQQAQRNIR